MWIIALENGWRQEEINDGVFEKAGTGDRLQRIAQRGGEDR
jgi:hypothetical protein